MHGIRCIDQHDQCKQYKLRQTNQQAEYRLRRFIASFRKVIDSIHAMFHRRFSQYIRSYSHNPDDRQTRFSNAARFESHRRKALFGCRRRGSCFRNTQNERRLYRTIPVRDLPWASEQSFRHILPRFHSSRFCMLLRRCFIDLCRLTGRLKTRIPPRSWRIPE